MDAFLKSAGFPWVVRKAALKVRGPPLKREAPRSPGASRTARSAPAASQLHPLPSSPRSPVWRLCRGHCGAQRHADAGDEPQRQGLLEPQLRQRARGDAAQRRGHAVQDHGLVGRCAPLLLQAAGGGSCAQAGCRCAACRQLRAVRLRSCCRCWRAVLLHRRPCTPARLPCRPCRPRVLQPHGGQPVRGVGCALGVGQRQQRQPQHAAAAVKLPGLPLCCPPLTPCPACSAANALPPQSPGATCTAARWRCARRCAPRAAARRRSCCGERSGVQAGGAGQLCSN